MRVASPSVISWAGSCTASTTFLTANRCDRAGLRDQLGDVIFVGAVMFPRGNQHRVLDRVQNDLRIDAFFLAQYLDGLKDRFQNVPRFRCAEFVSGGLPLELQIGFFHLIESEADVLPPPLPG